eukprot:4732180-Amphidinium_carterae.2
MGAARSVSTAEQALPLESYNLRIACERGAGLLDLTVSEDVPVGYFWDIIIYNDLTHSLSHVNNLLQDKVTAVWMWHYDEELWTWDKVYDACRPVRLDPLYHLNMRGEQAMAQSEW